MDVRLCLFRRMSEVSGPGEACTVDSSGISHKKLLTVRSTYFVSSMVCL